MKICAISDLHGDLPTIEECDILLIAGDIVPLEIQKTNEQSADWFSHEFKDWAVSLPCKKVYFIAGNHDFYLYRTRKKTIDVFINDVMKLSDKLIYLEDNMVTLDNGITLYGCPWCTGPFGWAFSPDELIQDISFKYTNIPDCDILLTHQPAAVGKLGCSYPDLPYERNWGSDRLREAIYAKKIGINICGHIHSGQHGEVLYPTYGCDTKFYNVSIKDEDYNIAYQPTYLTI